MIEKLDSLGYPIEEFVSYEKLRDDIIAGKRVAMYMTTTFRAMLSCENLLKTFESKDDITFTEYRINHKSGGGFIGLYSEKQLKNFDGVLIK